MSGLRRLAWFIVATVAGGCGARSTAMVAGLPDSGGALGAGAGASDEAAALQEWEKAMRAAQCDLADRCSTEIGPVYASRADCLAVENFDAVFKYFGGVGYYDQIAQLYHLADEPTRQACLTAIQSLPCSDVEQTPAACENSRVPKSPIAAGQSCQNGGWALQSACEPGLECIARDGPRCAICGTPAPLPLMGPCLNSGDCATGYCDPRLGCRPASDRHREGDSCYGKDCLWQLDCAGPINLKTCRPFAKMGEPCGGALGASCLAGLACIGATGDQAGHCVDAELEDGQACHRSLDPPFCRAWCIFPTPDAIFGVCGLPAATPDDTPCTAFSGDYELFCDADHYADFPGTQTGSRSNMGGQGPDGGLPASCVCHPLLVDGAKCQQDVQCITRHCSAEGGLPGVCSLPADLEGRCASDVDCTSGYCSPTERKCALRCTVP